MLFRTSIGFLFGCMKRPEALSLFIFSFSVILELLLISFSLAFGWECCTSNGHSGIYCTQMENKLMAQNAIYMRIPRCNNSSVNPN